MEKKKIIIIAGGTGGHIFPGLVIADYLITKGWKIRWIGSRNRFESEIIPKKNIEIDFIDLDHFYVGGIRKKIFTILNIYRSIRQIKKIFYSWNPNIVLGMGGYISFPGIVAAWMCNIPTIIHEQNRIAGLTNRILSKISNKILQAFPNTISKAIVVGNPIRKEILNLPNSEIRFSQRSGLIRVLVMGGSQGARILNKIMPQVACRLIKTITIWHQTGKRFIEKVKEKYSLLGIKNCKIVEFITNISEAYNWADIVICRSGAITVSEISYINVPAIFVPFVHKDFHQYWNALPLEQSGLAIIIQESDFNIDNVSRILSNLNRNILFSMSKKSVHNLLINSTKLIVDEINSTLK